jgi:hypothetical protein
VPSLAVRTGASVVTIATADHFHLNTPRTTTLGLFLGSLFNNSKLASRLRAVRHFASALDIHNEAVTAVFLSDFFEMSGIGWTSPSIVTLFETPRTPPSVLSSSL